jgi:hypothetical protein
MHCIEVSLWAHCWPLLFFFFEVGLSSSSSESECCLATKDIFVDFLDRSLRFKNSALLQHLVFFRGELKLRIFFWGAEGRSMIFGNRHCFKLFLPF